MIWEYHEGHSLEDAIYATIHVFEDSRSAYYDELTGVAKQVVDALERMGRSTLLGLTELMVPRELEEVYARGHSVRSILDELNDQRAREVALERIEIGLAFTYSTAVRSRAERAMDLSELFLEERPGEPALRFLRRLTRCYVTGFLPECVMLCRAILENALKEAFERTGEQLPEKQRDRIDRAYDLKWLSYDGKRAAHDVWTRGNKAIHDDPEVTKDVLGTVGMCVLVLKEVCAV